MADIDLVTAVRDTLDEVLAERLSTPTLLEVAAGAPVAGKLRRDLADIGLSGICVPERRGGLAADDALVAELFAVAGRRLLPHALRQEVMALAPALAALADAGVSQADDLLARYLAGTLAGGGAPVLPIHPAGLRELVDGGHRITVRSWVAEEPEVVAVVSQEWIALLPGAAAAQRPGADDGVDRGHRGCQIDVDSQLLADAQVVEVDASPVVDRWLLAIFAELYGVADHALTRSLDYAKQRHQFGRPIGSQQAVAHRLADMAVRVEAAAAAVSRHVETLANGDRERIADEQRVLQYWAPAMARQVCEDAIQVHGGTGFTWEYGLHLHYRRALALQALFGGADRAARRAAAALLPGLSHASEHSKGGM